jgi:hypothetical protein
MGTYHPIVNSTSVNKNKRRRTKKTKTHLSYEQTAGILENLINDPHLSLSEAGRQVGIGESTLSNWFCIYPNKIAGRKPSRNYKVAEWFQSSTDGVNNLDRFLAARPRQRVDQQIRDEVAAIVNKDDKVATHLQADDLHWINKPLDGIRAAVAVGTFKPTTTDDLLVVRGEAQAVKDEVLAIADTATRLVDAIDLVREALTTSDQLKVAMGRIDHYESRIAQLEETLKRFQQEKLATNQVHSRD